MTEAQTAYDRYRAQRRFGSLDGLRFFCIALVLWHHAPLVLGPTTELPQILQRGFTGVDFFFVLSGYLITTLLLREEEATGRISLAGFYRRRILRIVPLYFLVVTLASVWWIGVRGNTEMAAYVPYYYLFLANFLNGHITFLTVTWSLSVEEQYYLFWPLLLIALPFLNRLRGGIAAALIGLFLLIEMGIFPEIEPFPATRVAQFTLPAGSYSAILLGALTGIVLHGPRGFAMAWRVLGHRFAPLVLLAVLCVVWQVLPFVLTGWPNLVMHGTMALLLASIVVREDHVLAPAMQMRLVARIGAISYGVYLWHLFGRHIGVELASAIAPGGAAELWLAFAIYIVAAIAIAECSFRWFESWFLSLKSKPAALRRQPE